MRSCLGKVLKPVADKPWFCEDCARALFPRGKPKSKPKSGYSLQQRQQKMRRANRNDKLHRTFLMAAIEVHSLCPDAMKQLLY